MPGGFYDAGPLKQVAINLFYGWGYDFYRAENRLRADDQLVRSKAAWLLGQARAALSAAEADHRREKLPPPSRAQPYPDPAAVAGAQALERVGRRVEALAALLQVLPTPENDRMTQRFRAEAPTLQALIDCDSQLIGQAELLRSMVEGQGAAATLGNLSSLEEGVSALTETLRRRERLLFATPSR